MQALNTANLYLVEKHEAGQEEILWQVKIALEKEGFKTCRHNTFMEWANTGWYRHKKHSNKEILTLYSFDACPSACTFDLAAASVSMDSGCLYFSLSIYYVTALEQAAGIKHIAVDEVLCMHEEFWFPQIADCFNELAITMALSGILKMTFILRTLFQKHFLSVLRNNTLNYAGYEKIMAKNNDNTDAQPDLIRKIREHQSRMSGFSKTKVPLVGIFWILLVTVK